MRKVFVILFTMVIVGAYAQAPDIQWQKSYGGSFLDYAVCIEQTSDGGYIVLGHSNSNDGDINGNHSGLPDYCVIKINPLGQIEWQKCYGGSYSEEAHYIQQTADGGYIIAGSSDSQDGDVTGNHGTWDFWIIKIDNAGMLQWQKSFGGSSDEVANSIIQTNDGGYIVVGYTNSSDGDVTGMHQSGDAWVIKMDNTGNPQWKKCFGGSNSEAAHAVKQTSDGNFIIAGWTQSNDGDASGNHGYTDVWLLKLNTAGDILWQKCYGGTSGESAYSMQIADDGGFVIEGIAQSNDGDVTVHYGRNDYWIIKTDGDGVLVWQKTLGGSESDEPDGNKAIGKTKDGGYIVAGRTFSTNGDVSGNHGASDFWVVKIDGNGNFVWQKCLGGTSSDRAFAIQQTTDGGFIITGPSFSKDGNVTFNHGDWDYWVVKLKGDDCPKPTISANKAVVNLCPKDSIKLTSSSAAYYLWNTGQTTKTITVKVAGSYTVKTSSNSGCVNTSDTTKVTYQSCTKPTGLATSNITSTSVKLSWSADTCAVGYQYEWRKKGTTTWTTAQTTSNNKTITGLSSNTTYQWRVIKACRIKPDTLTSSYTIGPEFTTLSFTVLSPLNTESSNGVAVIPANAVILCSILPNPSKGNATLIINDNNEKVKIKISDASGKLVWQTSTSESSIILPFSSFTSGVYNVQVISSSGEGNIKFVKL